MSDGVHMPTLQEQIAEKFLAKLAENKDVESEKIEQIRILLESNRKPKGDDFVRIFSAPTGGEVK